jgi:hypothetical protein
MTEETQKLVQRLKNTSDGKDFISYLQQLSTDNYKQWKLEGGDVLRGKAVAFDELILLFENIDEKIINSNVVEEREWM